VVAIDTALVVGAAAAAVRVFRRSALARVHHADGIREPLLALAWIVCAGAISAWPLVRLARATRREDRPG
jgi:hypothetical protein